MQNKEDNLSKFETPMDATEVVLKIPEVKHAVDNYNLDSFFTEALGKLPRTTDEIFDPEIEIQMPVPENTTRDIPVQSDLSSKDMLHPILAKNIPPPKPACIFPATGWATAPSYENMHLFSQSALMMVTNPVDYFTSNQPNRAISLDISAPPPVYTHPLEVGTASEEKWKRFLQILENAYINNRVTNKIDNKINYQSGFVKDILKALPGCSTPEDMVDYIFCINQHISGNFAEYSKALKMLAGKAYFRVLLLLGGEKKSVKKMVTGHLDGHKGLNYKRASYIPDFCRMLQSNIEEINKEIPQLDRGTITMILEKNKQHLVAAPNPMGASEKQNEPAQPFSQPFLAKGVSGNMGMHVQTKDSPCLFTKQSFFASGSEQRINNKRQHDTAFFSQNISYKKRMVESPMTPQINEIQHIGLKEGQPNILDKVTNNPLAAHFHCPINPVGYSNAQPANMFKPQMIFITRQDVEEELSSYNNFDGFE